MKTWRILRQPESELSDPLSADEIATWLWQSDDAMPWVEPIHGGEGACPQELPEIRAVLLQDPAAVAAAWFGQHRQPAWLHLGVMDLTCKQPRDAWPVVKALVAAARSDEDLSLVGAGPLEDLLRHHGEEVIGWVEAEAKSNQRFRFALAGVWRSSITPAVWERVTVALGSQVRY